MSVFSGPSMVTDGLRVSYDVDNIKCYPGTGGTLFSLNDTENATANSIITVNDPGSNKVLDFNNSTIATVTFSPLVNHELWSLQVWVRSTGLTASNYLGIIRLNMTGGPGYVYILDTRETTNSYVLGYQRDYYINSWLTTAFMNASQWAEQTWWCLGVSQQGTLFKSYRQGELFSTQTQTRDVEPYTDITTMEINRNAPNTVLLGPVLFYDRILTDGEFSQNFHATRGRFGV